MRAAVEAVLVAVLAAGTGSVPRGARPDTPADAGAERDETARALERALVRQGSLVLRPWSGEIEPGVDYVYRETNAIRRDTIGGAVAGRLGLPLGAQIDVRLPWVLLDRAAGLRGSGLGDVELGLTKQLVVGAPGSSIPDLLASGRWKSTTGSSRGDLPPGSGAHGIEAAVTAVGRDDPLVLVGTAFYAWNLRSGEVDRGDVAGVALRVLLAATPDTSLLLGLDGAMAMTTRTNGRSVKNSERLSAVLNIGLSKIVGRDQFVSLNAAVGVTPVAPDLELSIALPLRL